jgi:hypothetical protein
MTEDMRRRWPPVLAALARVLGLLLAAIPLVAAVCFVLTLAPAPRVVSFVAALLGVVLLMAADTVQSKSAAAAGGILAMGGVLAWALMAAPMP